MATTIREAHDQLTAPGQMFEMETVEVDGYPVRMWKNAPRSLRAVLEQSQGRGDLGFLVYEDETLTFEQHFRTAAHLGRILQERYGVEKGDRVAIAMRNYPEWSIAFWAAAAIGAVIVPLNAWWTAPELVYGFEDSGSKVVFLDEERAERLADELPKLGLAGVIVAKPTKDTPNTERWEEVLGDVPADATLPDVDVTPDDLATIFYTSGTTGKPKGALGTQRNICSNLLSLVFANARRGLRASKPDAPDAAGSQNTYLLSVPFFHATGCHSVLVANLAFGGKIVIMHKWDASRALELIERERVTTFGGVPAMVWQVLEHPDFSKRDISSVKSIGYGGAPAPPELVRRIEAMFPGRSPSNGYGLTETSSVTTMNNGEDYIAKPDSVGVPVAVCEVKVVDPATGEEVATGEVGELWIKGPNVVKGYWNKPEATEAAFGGGWFRSGDGARLDEEGFVYIVDRIKDMVIRGGENVYCAEIEAAMFEHPEVSDVAVIGVPHDVLGEEVGAVVLRTPGSSVTAEELQQHVRDRLAAFKVPTHFFFRDEPLPRNPQGKILKRELKDELLGS
jgi:long-chain acyl-CoA synthetase